MKIKTKSGVLITLVNEASSKIILFDTLVRAVELTKEEQLMISAFLNSESKGSHDSKIVKK